MNTILGIEVPSSFDGLPADQVSEIIEEVRAKALATLRQGSLTAAQVAECETATTFVKEGRAYLDALAEAEDEANDRLDALEAELSDDGDDDDENDDEDDEDGQEEGSPVPDEEGEGSPEPEREVSANASEGAEADSENQPEPVTASSIRRRRPTARSLAERVPPDKVTTLAERAPIIALPGNSGIAAGERFETTGALADALQSRWHQLGGGSDERLAVARVIARYPKELQLEAGDNAGNIAKFGGLDLNSDRAQAAITAAVCAPPEPFYGLGCESSTARPLWDSLPKYQAPRGNVMVYPSPKLSDIMDDNPGGSGFGLWTQDDDANPNAVKTACAQIPCADPITYGIYGAYACMTITNMAAMTYPELVEAFMNRLMALHARSRERALLDAMRASVNVRQVTADAGNETASIATWVNIVNLLSAVREEERFDDITFEAWAPRWVREALRVDGIRQKNVCGSTLTNRAVGRGEVDAAFASLGVNIHWLMDNPSNGWPDVPIVADGETIPNTPNTAPFFLSPRGNFRALDGGNLTIGVTNNNIYRDIESLKRNNFTFFIENFEGIIDFGCTSYELTVDPFCPHGAQTEDIAAVTC